jgi:hypothetical protein
VYEVLVIPDCTVTVFEFVGLKSFIIPRAIDAKPSENVPVAPSILARSLFSAVNPLTQNTIELLDHVLSVATTRFQSFHAHETADPNKYESFGVVIAYAACEKAEDATHISVNPVVSSVLLSGYTAKSAEEFAVADLFCIPICV